MLRRWFGNSGRWRSGPRGPIKGVETSDRGAVVRLCPGCYKRAHFNPLAGPMKRSTDRILTTNVGSLIRPPKLQEFLRARQKGNGFDQKAYDQCLTDAVADVVRQQAQTGVDVVSDGEFGKSISWRSEEHTSE